MYDKYTEMERRSGSKPFNPKPICPKPLNASSRSYSRTLKGTLLINTPETPTIRVLISTNTIAGVHYYDYNPTLII